MAGRAAGALVLAALLGGAPAGRGRADADEPPRRRLTVEDAVRLAREREPGLGAARRRLEAARDLRTSTFGQLLPGVQLADQYQHWNAPYVVGLSSGQAPVALRNADTNTLSVTATQPLVSLLRGAQAYRAQERGVDAAAAGLAVSGAALDEQVRVLYLQHFLGRAEERVAAASEEELRAQARIAGAQARAGVLTRAELLRVEVAVANATQQRLAARTRQAVALAQLMALLALPADGSAAELVEPEALLEPPPPAPAFVAAQAMALSLRPELRQAAAEASSLRHTARARALALLPDAAAQAAYLRTDGQLFQPPDAAYVGVVAQWMVWDWGTLWYQYRAAAAQARAAELDEQAARERVGAEVASLLSEAREAESAVAVADEAVKGAEEAYRETFSQRGAGTATTTDLLSAEAALTQARANREAARYQRAIARVRLQRATGHDR